MQLLLYARVEDHSVAKTYLCNNIILAVSLNAITITEVILFMALMIYVEIKELGHSVC